MNKKILLLTVFLMGVLSGKVAWATIAAKNSSATMLEDATLTMDLKSLISGVTSGTVTFYKPATNAALNGTVQITPAGIATFNPTADFFGQARFNFYAKDGLGIASQIAGVSVTVTPVNDDAPVAIAMLFATSQNQPITVTLSATDVDGDLDLTYAISGTPEYGTVLLEGRNARFTPAPNYAGSAAYFRFTAKDSTGKVSAPAKVSIMVLAPVMPNSPTIITAPTDSTTISVQCPPVCPALATFNNARFTPIDVPQVSDFNVMSHMQSSTVEVQYCERHFPEYSAARTNLKLAVAAWQDLPDTSFKITTVAKPHRGGDALFNTIRDGVIAVDYVDVNDGEKHRCNKGAEGWYANSCKYSRTMGMWDSTGGAGDTLNIVSKADYAVLQINAARPDNFYKCWYDNPSATSCDSISETATLHYIGQDSLQHEFSHMFGNTHVEYWNDDQDKTLLSIISEAGNGSVTARDLEFFQRIYPGTSPVTPEFSVASLIINDADGIPPTPDQDCANTYDRHGQLVIKSDDERDACESAKLYASFTDYNTRTLYIDPQDNYLKDCDTKKYPVVKETFFNLSGEARTDQFDILGRLSIDESTDYGDSYEHVLERMPALTRYAMGKNEQLDWKADLRISKILYDKMSQSPNVPNGRVVDLRLEFKSESISNSNGERDGFKNNVSPKATMTVLPDEASCIQ